MATLDFISAVQYTGMIHFINHFIQYLNSSIETLQMWQWNSIISGNKGLFALALEVHFVILVDRQLLQFFFSLGSGGGGGGGGVYIGAFSG